MLAHHAWQRRLNCPQTTAAGRLFDAAAALTGLNHRSSYEGQGPMMLEAACTDAKAEAIPLPMTLNRQGIRETTPRCCSDERKISSRRSASGFASWPKPRSRRTRRREGGN
jgi:hydrogenase maturation factor HypF (carbamoyltransferase family)